MAENPIADWLFGVKQAQKPANKTAPPIRGRGALPSKEARETKPNPRQPGYYKTAATPVAAPTVASPPAATRTAYDYFGKPATSGAPFNPSGKRSVIKPGPDPLSTNTTKRNVSLQTTAGRGQAKGVPEPVKKPRPASGRPASVPSSRKSPEAAAKQVVANAPAAKPTPAPAVKKSWWDKFSDDHKLSADKSYADYKKLMESM